MGSASVDIVAFGECMLELRAVGDHWQLGYGGDTLNTAIYLSRLGERVAYMTVLGEDWFSANLRSQWFGEGIDTGLILTAPGRHPGLYAIQTDADGERHFFYWRSDAAIRDLFRLPDWVNAFRCAGQARMLYVSGVTLALFGEEERAQILQIAMQVRQSGGAVVFDPNYRPRLWARPELARDAFLSFAQAASIVLPTFDDEAMLFGDANPAQTQLRWRSAGVAEIVVKIGSRGCVLCDGTIVGPVGPLMPIDTTGAGDAFNAGYLAARRHGASEIEAAGFANLLAGRVIGQPGAIMPRDEMPEFPFVGR